MDSGKSVSLIKFRTFVKTTILVRKNHHYMPKVSTFKNLIQENGPVWVLLYTLERLLGKTGNRWRVNYEKRHLLPGFNTKFYNHRGWTKYDWSKNGEEWNDSPEWRESIINLIIRKYISGGRILEIGPGAGKWSKYLLEIADKLILVDLTETSITLCRKHLNQSDKCEFHVNDGSRLNFIDSSSIDYLWAFDTFVHIAPKETANYLKEISRVLKPGATGVIHHPRNGGHLGGFRSSVTNDFFLAALAKNNLKVITQFASWGPNGEFSVSTHDDLITVFSKP